MQQGAASNQESSTHCHATAACCVADEIAAGARCVPDGSLLRSENSTLLAFISLPWCQPLPRGGGGSLPGGTSTGLFVDLELASRSMISYPSSMAVGGAAVPARGSPIARDADGGDGGAVGGLLPHVRAQQLHGPRRRSSFSTTRWY